MGVEALKQSFPIVGGKVLSKTICIKIEESIKFVFHGRIESCWDQGELLN